MGSRTGSWVPQVSHKLAVRGALFATFPAATSFVHRSANPLITNGKKVLFLTVCVDMLCHGNISETTVPCERVQ